jgi:hypothetical protein
VCLLLIQLMMFIQTEQEQDLLSVNLQVILYLNLDEALRSASLSKQLSIQLGPGFKDQ